MKLPIADATDWSQDPHGMSYDNPRFWDPAHLDAEVRRVFEICNGCRLCFNLCPSFDVLFKRIDALDPFRDEAEGKHLAGGMLEEHEAKKLLEQVEVHTESPVSLLAARDRHRVVELCYECKLCFPKCPYVPPHEFAVDFPRLMLRAKMAGAKKDGIALRERFLGATDAVGSVMTKVAPLANAAAHNRFNRVLMEHAVGIHRDRQLPGYADESFLTWWERRAPLPPPADPSSGVALFATCYGNYNDPEIPKAAVEVLERAGCSVSCPDQVCCGMPKLDGGDLEGARRLARHNVEALLPAVREGRKIVSPGPSCTLVLRTEYPELVGTEEARQVSEAVMDLSDFLLHKARQKKLPKDFEKPIGRVAYHVACHNRVQNLGYRGRDLLKWAGADVQLVDRCCGMDGTWGMKTEFFAESLKVAEAAAGKVETAEPDVVSSDCPLAGLQLRQKTGRAVYHPVRILRAAYRGEPLRSPKGTGGGDVMRKLELKDLWPLPVYEGVRHQFRREVIAAKQARRVTVGPFMTLVFENRVTVKFQVQEILRVEKITDEAQVLEELEGFNSMLPRQGELSATLLIELTGSDRKVKEELARLAGLGDHLWLEVAGARSRGSMEGGRDDGQRVAAVQYVRFPVEDAFALREGPVALVIDHPSYTHRQELPEAVRKSLAQDHLPEAG